MNSLIVLINLLSNIFISKSHRRFSFMKWFVIIFFILPIILFLLYGIIKPKESFMLGRRWQFKGEVEPSEFALDMHRIYAIALLIVVIIILISVILA